MSQLPGYQGKPEQILRKARATVFDNVEVVTDTETFSGVLMPRYELADNKHVVIKLRTGYNIGIRIDKKTKIRKLKPRAKRRKPIPSPPKKRPPLPKVTIVSTGGTIASRVDYRTGAVRAALSAEELYSLAPELADVADIEAQNLYNVYSENITTEHWTGMARTADKLIRDGSDGIVFAHGTDTLALSSAALSFALQKPPVPVVFVGAQRSSDRPSSDAFLNLLAATTVAANAPFGEVVLSMHDRHSDDRVAVHRGTKVRKLHTSARNAFASINNQPIAYYQDGGIRMNVKDVHPRDSREGYAFRPDFGKKAALVKFYPDFDPETLNSLVSKGTRGIVLEGTGLGHVSSVTIPHAKKLIRDGVFIGMTSQCLFGSVNMRVYDTGRDLLSAGVTPLLDMLPETALVKLMWCLGQTDDVHETKKLMTTNLAGEFSERCLPITKQA